MGIEGWIFFVKKKCPSMMTGWKEKSLKQKSKGTSLDWGIIVGGRVREKCCKIER